MRFLGDGVAALHAGLLDAGQALEVVVAEGVVEVAVFAELPARSIRLPSGLYWLAY